MTTHYCPICGKPDEECTLHASPDRAGLREAVEQLELSIAAGEFTEESEPWASGIRHALTALRPWLLAATGDSEGPGRPWPYEIQALIDAALDMEPTGPKDWAEFQRIRNRAARVKP